MTWQPSEIMPDLGEDEQWERARKRPLWPALLFTTVLGGLIGASVAMLVWAAL
jgi:hypothetical protein